MRRLDDGALRYGLAFLAVVFALYLEYLLAPIFGSLNPFATVWLAVIFSAWYCGLGPSIVVSLIGAMGVWYWFLPPYHSFATQNRSQVFGMIGFLVFSDCVIALAEAHRRESPSRIHLAAIVDSLEDAIVSEDLDGVITNWNHGAQNLFGWSRAEVVGRLSTIIVPPERRDDEFRVLKRLGEGEHIERYATVCVTKGGERRDVFLTVSLMKDHSGRMVGATKIVRDLTERKETEAKLQSALYSLEHRVRARTAELQEKNEELVKQREVVQELSAYLLRSQDEERRHIARELHDSVGQLLAAMNINTSRVAKEKGKLSADANRCIEQNEAIAEQLSQQIRTMSYLLHPPLLDEAGLESAIRWYIDGFAERSKIKVHFDIAENFDRLPDDQEIAIFRVVQECLTNIHRHSGSPTAAIRIARTNGQVHLEVRDQGKGIPLEKQVALNSSGKLGVGVRGMRERLRQLGGELRIHSDGKGTLVTAQLPVEQAKEGTANT